MVENIRGEDFNITYNSKVSPTPQPEFQISPLDDY
jgi:hypothetical protein